jgi:hypothetical protein
MEIPKKEIRRFPRVKYTTPIRVQVRGSEKYSRTVGENLSATGLCFVNNDFIAPLTPVMLEIEVLSRVLHPIGRIVWSAPLARSNRFKLGTEFVEFPAEEQRFLSDFVGMTR